MCVYVELTRRQGGSTTNPSSPSGSPELALHALEIPNGGGGVPIPPRTCFRSDDEPSIPEAARLVHKWQRSGRRQPDEASERTRGLERRVVQREAEPADLRGQLGESTKVCELRQEDLEDTSRLLRIAGKGCNRGRGEARNGATAGVLAPDDRIACIASGVFDARRGIDRLRGRRAVGDAAGYVEQGKVAANTASSKCGSVAQTRDPIANNLRRKCRSLELWDSSGVTGFAGSIPSSCRRWRSDLALEHRVRQRPG